VSSRIDRALELAERFVAAAERIAAALEREPKKRLKKPAARKPTAAELEQVDRYVAANLRRRRLAKQ
jgi:hypothetical protein